jgi:transposase-like protein
MVDFGLSVQQIQVIDALSSGVTVAEAAAQAGVHRNTINNWRRNVLPFQHALSHAQYDRALLFREKAEALVAQAFEALASLLADPKTPAGVRLKAALFVIEKAVTPPPPKQQVLLDIEKIHVSAAPPVTVTPDLTIVPPVHKNAQETVVHNLHNSAQNTCRREHPKVGRNQPCPCNSGKKYKHCCLNSTPLQSEAAAA